ncbi:cell division protein FtsW [Candidatus Termititenax persephonae]|uniref:Probable peptidoglycan glycosyltransferase FtsW n=1 Tax=Candidatus Termititenax persephonae TaxID=2218525 RepID=A0A388TFX2_9BACT|nr:cell division protein FtsW [Candidatus Termititenax persephonae]
MLRRVDGYLLWPAVALLAVGVLTLFSVTPISGAQYFQNEFYFVIRQSVALLIGGVLCLLASRWDYRKLRKLAPFGLLLSVFLLLLTYLPGVGVMVGGASRWLGYGSLSFQPSELAKFCLILYVAAALTNKKNGLRSFWQDTLPILTVCGAVVLAILRQPDLGTSLVVLATILAMLFVGGSNFTDLLILGLLGFRALVYLVAHTPYQWRRWTAFLDPLGDRFGAGFNTIQSLIAVGSGGLFGVGMGNSRQKFAYLPQHYTDYIFAMICEERGFILAAAVVLLWAFLVLRGIRLASRVADPFGAFLALGFSLCLGIQSLVHILVVLGWIPATGITLPFISYGGSSLVTSLLMLGIILRISREE